MFGGMDPRQMSKMMKQLGVNTQEMRASKVTIETDKGTIVLGDALVIKMKMQGEAMYQVMPKTETVEEAKSEIPEDDVKMVAEQTGKTASEARNALEENNGDIAKAIESLS